jgi:hypothetical protein
MTCESVPAGQSYLNVDLSSPRFADAIQSLLARYAPSQSSVVVALDRSRFLIMVLLFRRICDVAAEFGHSGWLGVLEERLRSMAATLQFYQVALGCPSMDPTTSDLAKERPIARIVIEEHIKHLALLEELQSQAQQRLPYPPVCRHGRLSVGPMHSVPVQAITSFAIMPLSEDHYVILANGKLFELGGTPKMSRVELPETCHASAVVVHPSYDIFLAITDEGPMLFYFNQGIQPAEFPHWLGKINCAAFSPTGSKLAFGSDVISIFCFDRAKIHYEPALRRDLKNPITALAWMNSDTMLAVGIARMASGV